MDERERHEAGGLFVLIGAEPRTEWLPGSILRDEWGYVMTGPEVQASGQWALDRLPLLYETSVPGVFAGGDVRNGPVKRIASAEGEGSVVIQGIHLSCRTLSLFGLGVRSSVEIDRNRDEERLARLELQLLTLGGSALPKDLRSTHA